MDSPMLRTSSGFVGICLTIGKSTLATWQRDIVSGQNCKPPGPMGPGGFQLGAKRKRRLPQQVYLLAACSLVDTVVKVLLISVPSVVAAVMIPTAMSAAMRPY